METSLMQIQSFCIVILMMVGIRAHKNRTLHVKIMTSAMVWDLLLILQIELSRSAVLKATKALSNHWMLNVHISIAVTSVFLYVLMIRSGRKLLAGNHQIRVRHRRMGYTTLLMRVLTFITSFWAVAPGFGEN